MPSLRPIPYARFEKFLQRIGCRLIRERGDHRAWIREGMNRPVIVRRVKDLPIFEIKSNLRTLGIATEQYLEMIGKD